MKFFSFIKDGDIRTAKKTKVIPKEEFEILMDAYELLEKVKHEMNEYRKETIAECERLKEQAYEEGLQDGLEKFNEATLKLNQASKKIHDDFERKITPLAIQAARKILGEELKLNPKRIVEIILQALKPITSHKHVKIFVSKADLEILEKEKTNIKNILDQVETFFLQERSDIEPGGCIIETEGGIINAQLENQWRALEAAFESFLKLRQ
jgi:type III secretion protein L